MEIISLASSSKGNSYCLVEGKDALILECGLPLKDVLRKLKPYKIKNIAVFITHEHLDHSKYVLDYLKAGYFVYSTMGTKIALIERMKDIQKYNNYFVFSEGKNTKYALLENIGSFSVLPFPTKHDSIEPCGYFINNLVTKEKVLFATDTYYIKERFKGITTVMIECNYSKDLLLENFKSGEISYTQYKRLLESHFELENVKAFIKATDTTSLKEVYLLHLSEKNSNELLFKKEIEKITGVPVYVCKERS